MQKRKASVTMTLGENDEVLSDNNTIKQLICDEDKE